MTKVLAELPPRERELLELAARPMSAKEIATETGLSVGTINNYLSSVQRRLGARNRVEAIRLFRNEMTDVVEKVHVNFPTVPAPPPPAAPIVAELPMPTRAPLHGLADSVAPRSRVSLEAFLGSTADEPLRLPSTGRLNWQKRLCVIVVLTVAIAFMMAAVVILLDALTRLTTTV